MSDTNKNINIQRYDAATMELAARVRAMQKSMRFAHKYDMADMVVKFRTAFKMPALRARVLAPQYEEKRMQSANFASGFCGIASYSWAHICRMPDGQPMWHIYQYANAQNVYGLRYHVWLNSAIDGSVLDLTYDQSFAPNGEFIGIPYHLGTRIDDIFPYQRAFVFGKYIGVDLRKLVLQNALRNERHGG